MFEAANAADPTYHSYLGLKRAPDLGKRLAKHAMGKFPPPL